jgi:membrane protein implicated in regulation of membrane protease activity
MGLFCYFDRMIDPADARRRWFGVLFLIISGGMLIWGQTLLKPHLTDIAFVVYWLVCLFFTALAMVTALLDVRAVRRRTRDQQRELFRHTLNDIQSDKKDGTRKTGR